MRDKIQAMLLASFAADALALGAHWIYDPRKIRDDFGEIRDYQQPPASSYHHTKKKGEFTHYGDQTLLLLRCLAEDKSFSLNEFATQWQRFMADYGGYKDRASIQTVANFAAGAGPESSGSSSSDLAGASRIGPLIYAYRDHADQELFSAVAAQTKMTHNHPLVMDSAVFFTRAVLAVLRGTAPVAALEDLATTEYAGSPLAQWALRAINTKGEDTVQTIVALGQSCQVQDAFPSVVHLVARYENDLAKALSQCVMAGGDSAGRGMIVGLLLGAHLGLDALPPTWLVEMRAYPIIQQYMNVI